MYLKLFVIVLCLGLSNSSAASTDIPESSNRSDIVLEVNELINSGKKEQELFESLKDLVNKLQIHVYGLVDKGAVEEGTDDFLCVCEMISPVWDNVHDALKNEFSSIEATLDLIADYINLHQ